MDVNIYLVGGVIIVLAIIILNHQRQKNRMRTYLQESNGTQLIFLQKSVEKKIKALSDILYDGGVRPAAGATLATGNNPKQVLVRHLEKLEKDFAAKKFPLRTYDKHLFDLLERANKLPVTA